MREVASLNDGSLQIDFFFSDNRSIPDSIVQAFTALTTLTLRECAHIFYFALADRPNQILKSVVDLN